jgi:chorismate mutase
MDLEKLRVEIDKVDEDVIRLLKQRFELTKLVGILKAETGISSLSPKRESEQFKKYQTLSEELDLPYPMVEKIFQTIRDQVLENHDKFKEEHKSK